MINFGGFDKKGYLLKILKLILLKDLFLGKKFILLTGFNNQLHLKEAVVHQPFFRHFHIVVAKTGPFVSIHEYT